MCVGVAASPVEQHGMIRSLPGPYLRWIDRAARATFMREDSRVQDTRTQLSTDAAVIRDSKKKVKKKKLS